MNFIKGTAARNNDELILNVGSLQFPLLEYCKEGNDYILGFRPEHIRFTGDEENLVSVMGIVELIEPLGSDSLVMADIGSTVVTIREDGQFNATMGETIKVRFDMKQSHLFDAETGMRIEA
jgi:multiple sugar transport system ATP-binding protein